VVRWAIIEQIRSFSHKYLPAADITPSFTRICLYTMTPDENFLIDVHPEHAHIMFASPCSGHGFKFSALVGSILTDLALKGSTEHDISLFRANRFTSEAATTGTHQ
jgi:sarcosine oxidase